jgi:acetyl-CoA C-acetyltransferase
MKRAASSLNRIDEVIFGCVCKGDKARMYPSGLIHAGIKSTAFTINKVCASGLRAISLAAQTIIAGDNDIVMAGGMECMSAHPYYVPNARWGYRMNMYKGELIDGMVYDGLWEIFNGYHMGITAENIAEQYGLTREEQDKFGYQSQVRAAEAIKSGRFKDEIVPVVIKTKKGETVFDTDEHPRLTDLEKMAKLGPLLRKTAP